MRTKSRHSRRGIAMITVLLITTVMLILISALVSMCTYNIRLTSRYRDKLASEELARAGVSYLMSQMSINLKYPETNPDIRWPAETEDPQRYFEVTFDPGKEFFSVNNLTGSSTVKNYRGQDVPANTADIFITAHVNNEITRIHVIFQGGLNTNKALTSMKQIHLGKGCLVMGIKKLPPVDGSIVDYNALLATNEKEQVPGILHSNYVTTKPEDSAIIWDAPSAEAKGIETIPEESEELDPGFKGIYMSKTSTISCVSGKGTNPVDLRIKNMLDEKYRDDYHYNERSTKVAIPEIDVNGLIDTAVRTGEPEDQAPVSTTDAFGFNVYKNSLTISKPTHFKGNYKIDGNLTLNGDLYVQGDLNVTGAITGTGAVYVSGDTTFKGSSKVVAKMTDGTTIFCDKNVTMAGFDLAGFLENIAEKDSTFKPILNRYYEEYTGLSTSIKYSDGEKMVNHMKNMASVNVFPVAPSEEPVVFDRPELTAGSNVNPTYPPGAVLPKMITYLKSLNRVDKEKQKMAVEVLEEMCFNLRDGSTEKPPAREGAQSEYVWDDETITIEESDTDGDGSYDVHNEIITSNNPSLQKIYYVISGKRAGTLDRGTDNYITAAKNFLKKYPKYLTGGGRSYYQGIVYAKGDLEVNNQFRVVGVAMVKGDVRMKQGAQLIYDQEYTRFNATTLPLFKITSWEEL